MTMPARQRKSPDDTAPDATAPDSTAPDAPPPEDDEPFEDEESLLLHDAYLEYRLAGGAPATPEAYRRAAEQFDRLPGVIRSRPGVGQVSAPGGDS